MKLEFENSLSKMQVNYSLGKSSSQVKFICKITIIDIGEKWCTNFKPIFPHIMLLSKIQMTLWKDGDTRYIFERVIIKSMLILSFKDSYNRTCCNGAFPDGTNNGLLFSLTTSICIWRIGYIYIYPNISSCFRCKKKNPLRRSNNNKQRFRVANLFSFQNFWTSCKKKLTWD